MANKRKPDLKDTIAASLKTAGAAAAKGAKLGIGAAKDGAVFAAKEAVKAKDAIDTKSRAALDKAYAAKRSHAVKNLARLKAANPTATPAEILDILETELKEIEKDAGADSEKFLSSTSMFVFTAVELYPARSGDAATKQRLIDAVVLLDSAVAKNVAKFGGLAVGILVARFTAAGRAAAVVGKLGSKIKWMTPLLAIAGIKNPGKKSAAWAVNAATRKILGAAPKTWPAEKAAPAKASAAKKPAAKKPVAKKPTT